MEYITRLCFNSSNWYNTFSSSSVRWGLWASSSAFPPPGPLLGPPRSGLFAPISPFPMGDLDLKYYCKKYVFCKILLQFIVNNVYYFFLRNNFMISNLSLSKIQSYTKLNIFFFWWRFSRTTFCVHLWKDVFSKGYIAFRNFKHRRYYCKFWATTFKWFFTNDVFFWNILMYKAEKISAMGI